MSKWLAMLGREQEPNKHLRCDSYKYFIFWWSQIINFFIFSSCFKEFLSYCDVIKIFSYILFFLSFWTFAFHFEIYNPSGIYCGVCYEVKHWLFNTDKQLSQHHFIPYWLAMLFLSHSKIPCMCGIFLDSLFYTTIDV